MTNKLSDYTFDYRSALAPSFLNRQLIVETAVFIKSFPTVTLDVASLVYDFLLEGNDFDVIENYSLEPFAVRMQNAERTFIDKVFALGDNYLKNKPNTYSRHIYDLYKLYPAIVFDDSFRQLIIAVREARKPIASCLSTKEGIDITELLKKIVSERFLETDYYQMAETVLNEDLPYSKAITVISRILEDGYFS